MGAAFINLVEEGEKTPAEKSNSFPSFTNFLVCKIFFLLLFLSNYLSVILLDFAGGKKTCGKRSVIRAEYMLLILGEIM